MPRKIRQLVVDLQHAGFVRVSGGKESHRKFIHNKFPGFVLISGHDGDDAQHYQEKQVPERFKKGAAMKTQDRYLMFVRWSEEDRLYVGYCPDLFPAGGVCHGDTPQKAFEQLCEVVTDTVEAAEAEGLPLPPPQTRPMREVEVAA